MPKGQYQRGIENAEDFIMAHIEIDQNGCWLWTGSVRSTGYGRVMKKHWGYWAAHRMSYEVFVGPIGEDREIDHLCRVRRCVNPAHLEPVSKRENCYRGFSFAAENKRKTHCANGHAFTPENTYIRPRGGRDCRMCQRKHVAEYTRRKRA